LRGYAQVSPEAAVSIQAMANPSPQALVGADAYLAITLDAGAGMQRYQGIVALEGESIAEALTNYFTQSEQLDVQVLLAVSAAQPHIAGGLMIERMPQTSEAQAEENQEAWRYATAIAATVKAAELLDPLLDAQTLLYRLFHESGVWVYAGSGLSVGCRCSRGRIEQMLLGMSATDRADMVVDGVASVHCQFCNKAELFTPSQLGLSIS
jgi:molecular chaperone Hsp33